MKSTKRYEFNFLDPSIGSWFKNKVIDRSRISEAECIKQGLPYVDSRGYIINTDCFRSAAVRRETLGSYTSYPKGSKGYADFWSEEKRRCREGLWLGQVRVSRYFYFFLNYYSMTLLDKDTKEERRTTPYWKKLTFDFFHLLEYCMVHKLNLSLIKPRSVGLTEAAASVGVCDFFVPLIDQFGEPTFKEHTYLASEMKYLNSADGLFNKMTKAVVWLNDKGQQYMYKPVHTQKNDEMLWKAGYRDKTTNQPHDTGGSIKCTVLTKPDDARAGRQAVIWWEESGANQKLSAALQVGLSLTNRFGETSGIHVIWGTSNADTRGVEAFGKVLSSPYSYGCVGFMNPWKGLEECNDIAVGKEFVSKVPLYPFEYMLKGNDSLDGRGYFITYLDVKGLDKDGNPDRVKAYELITEERRRKSAVSGADNDIMAFTADHPITMEEALYKKGTDFFNRRLLGLRHQELVLHKSQPLPDVGDVTVSKTREMKFVKDIRGKVQVLEPPIKDPVSGALKNLYIIGYDGIDAGTDNSQTGKNGSKMCAVVYKRMYGTSGSMVVAMYWSRPGDEREGYDEVLKLSQWYGAQVCIEDSKRSIVTYFRSKGEFSRLYTRPRIARMDMNKYKADSKVGVPANEKYIIHGLELMKHYVNDHCDNIYFPDLLNQMLEYTYEDKSKYDIIAAFMMALIADEDLRPAVESQAVQAPSHKIGHYRDSQGYKRFGKIPLSTNPIGNVKPRQDYYYDSEGTITYT